jgi:hypothetical protein
MDVGTGIVIGGLFVGAAVGGALLLSDKKEAARASEAEERAAAAQAELAIQRRQQAQQPLPVTGSKAGSALNGVANVLQSLGGASGINSLLSFALNK